MMSRSDGGPATSVITGLAVLGLLVSSVVLLDDVLGRRNSEAHKDIGERGACIYEVSHGQYPMGVVCLREPARLSIILASLNLSVPSDISHEDSVVPCDTRLQMTGLPGEVRWYPAAAETILTLGGRIDLNAAEEEDLSLVPGIGAGLAQKIVDHRRRNGIFLSMEELERVPGLGKKTRSKIEGFLKISHQRHGQSQE
jgi:competence ComEA-like helix-hairpin-helix protein